MRLRGGDDDIGPIKKRRLQSDPVDPAPPRRDASADEGEGGGDDELFSTSSVDEWINPDPSAHIPTADPPGDVLLLLLLLLSSS